MSDYAFPPIMANDIFYQVDGLNLVDGNETAGFELTIPFETLALLRSAEVREKDRLALQELIRDRVARAGILPGIETRYCSVSLLGNTPLPLSFAIDPQLGIALSTDSGRIGQNGPANVDYQPANIHRAGEALTLLVIVQTWAEWARHHCATTHMRLAA